MIVINYTIRESNNWDKEGLYNFFEKVITATFLKEGLADLTDDIRDEIQDKLEKHELSLQKDTRYRFFIAENDLGIIGTTSINEPGSFANQHIELDPKTTLEIGSIYVNPDYQSRGIGKALLQYAINYLRENGYQQFLLDSGFIKAQKIWKHLLGEPQKILKDFWGSGNDHMFWHIKL